MKTTVKIKLKSRKTALCDMVAIWQLAKERAWACKVIAGY